MFFCVFGSAVAVVLLLRFVLCLVVRWFVSLLLLQHDVLNELRGFVKDDLIWFATVFVAVLLVMVVVVIASAALTGER